MIFLGTTGWLPRCYGTRVFLNARTALALTSIWRPPWGFMTSLLGGPVIAHAEEISAPPAPDEWIPAPAFFGILLALFLVSAAALISTIRQRLFPA